MSSAGLRGSVVLVGPSQQENLGLQYLASSLLAQGFGCTLGTYNSRDDTPAVVALVCRLVPDIVGIGMAFQYAATDALDLVRALRDAGYEGHITAGGHVATFCHHEILQGCPELDSAVRHEGEQTLVEMAGRITAGRSLAGVAGCVWRSKEGLVVEPARPVAKDLDCLPEPYRAGPPYVVGGLPIAFLLTSRGCSASCAYCCIRAFYRDAGGPPMRLRRVDAVASEIVGLAQRGVRILFLQDDLFVLPEERAAIARIDELARAVGDAELGPLAFWVKSQPASVTPALVAAVQRLGAMHLFLGIENVVDDRLRYLGRTHSGKQALRALALCSEAGLQTSFNLMLFDPESSLEDAATCVDFAQKHLDLLWNVCRTEIYPGTLLFDRLRSQGKLLGDTTSYSYGIADERAELAFRVLRICLHDRAFACTSLLNCLITLSVAARTHQRFFPGRESDELAREVADIGRAARQDTVDLLRRVFDFAAHANPSDQDAAVELATSQALAANERDWPRRRRIDRLWNLYQARGGWLLSQQQAPASA